MGVNMVSERVSQWRNGLKGGGGGGDLGRVNEADSSSERESLGLFPDRYGTIRYGTERNLGASGRRHGRGTERRQVEAVGGSRGWCIGQRQGRVGTK